MLRRDVYDLATTSLTVAVNPRRAVLRRRMREVMERLASRGILGGPTFGMLADVCGPEIDERVRLAGEELRRACDSKGVAYYRRLSDDLATALDDLTANLFFDVFNSFNEQARAVPFYDERARVEYRQIFDGVAFDAKQRAKSDLRHNSEQLKTRRGISRREMLGRIGWTILGAILGAAGTKAVESLVSVAQGHRAPQKANFASTPSPHPSK